MATLREITDNLSALLQKPNDQFTKRQIAYNLRVYRGLLIEQRMKRHQTIKPIFVQSLGCQETEKGYLVECCTPVTNIQCKVLRTKSEIPVPIHYHGKAPFAYVGGLNGDKSYTYVAPNELSYHLAGKFGDKLNFYTYANGKVYIFGESQKKINITGVFDNPEILQQYTDCDSNKCWTPDDDYPITLAMVQQIGRALLAGEFKLLVPTDDHEVETKEKP